MTNNKWIYILCQKQKQTKTLGSNLWGFLIVASHASFITKSKTFEPYSYMCSPFHLLNNFAPQHTYWYHKSIMYNISALKIRATAEKKKHTTSQGSNVKRSPMATWQDPGKWESYNSLGEAALLFSSSAAEYPGWETRKTLRSRYSKGLVSFCLMLFACFDIVHSTNLWLIHGIFGMQIYWFWLRRTCMKYLYSPQVKYQLLHMMIGKKTGIEVSAWLILGNIFTLHQKQGWPTCNICSNEFCIIPPNSEKFYHKTIGFRSATSFRLRPQPCWPRNGKSTCSPCNASVLLDGQLATLDLGTKKTCQNGRHWDLLTKQVVVLYLWV